MFKYVKNQNIKKKYLTTKMYYNNMYSLSRREQYTYTYIQYV